MTSFECQSGMCDDCDLSRCACECHDDVEDEDTFDSDEFGEDPEAEFERRFQT